MEKVIVSTSINPPTEAIQLFDAMEDWSLVVIGDVKTPKDYKLDRGFYFGPDEQEKYDKRLSEAVGWNCVQRRNFGFLIAREMGAKVVAVVDDDNIPMDNWGHDLMINREVEVNYYETDLAAFDPVGATNYPLLWHRGYPLQLISQRNYMNKRRRKLKIDIQADFWDGDPDVDAICRIEHAPVCTFDPVYFPISANKIAPFNSQNTFLSGRVLKDYFLYPHIGRMDDIWASYYVQAKGYRIAFGKASVYQRRNAHDLFQDMRQELLGYEKNLSLIRDLTSDPESISAYLPDTAVLALRLYRTHFERDAKCL